MAKTEYSEEVKAAVMTALLTGQSVTQIAREYKIPASTIRSWKSRQNNGESVATVATQKKQVIGDLLIKYLETSLETLQIQAKHFGDVTWLKKQSANELAVLHGVATDKSIRLLEALAGQTEDEDE